jgi:glycosyltransferase involved in cell wall biosynthesis
VPGFNEQRRWVKKPVQTSEKQFFKGLKDLRKRMRNAGRERVEKEFDLPVLARRLSSILRDLSGNDRQHMG